MGGLRQDRVGGGRTNTLPTQINPPTSRPSTAGSRRASRSETTPEQNFQNPSAKAPALALSMPVLALPRSRPASAPASRPSTAGSARLQRPWQQEGEAGSQHLAGRSAPGFGARRDESDVRRDELYSGKSAGSGHGPEGGNSRASSRPGTEASRTSSSSGLPPRAARPMTAPAVRAGQERPETANSETSSACEERLLTFQKFFQDKNFAKFSALKDAFRDVDKDKNGVLGPKEVGMAMAALDIPIDRNIIDRLMSRCDDPEQMSMQEFKELLWIDDTMSTYIDDRKNRRAGVASLPNPRVCAPLPHATRVPSPEF